MRNIVNSYVRRFRTERRRSRRAIAMLLALALLVATGVTWQLHSTGIALTNETYCGQEEHTHTEDCYGTVLSCGLAESEGHTHTEDCYETVTTLVCGLEESVGHTHDESCYDEEGNLICGQEESEGHTHTEDCYVTEQVLICGLEESEGHTHTEECYETQLICGLEEHTHTVECLIDETADVETAADWEATIPSLSGDWAEDLVSVAKSQLGYAESTANYTLADDGETHKGYTRYGAWYGNKYGDWDAMFVSFCLHYAGVPASYVTQASGAYAWTAALSGSDYYTTASDYTPEPGDIVFFDRNSDGVADCTGIVITVSGSNMTVIEGNSDDAVEQNTYDIADAFGFVSVSAAYADYAGVEEVETKTLNYEGEDYIVTVTYGEDAELPENVELVATEYAKDDETYLARYAEAAELYGWDEDEDHTDSIRLFNIGFYNEDGEEIEPAAQVQVTITYLEQEQETDYTIAHFGADETETLDTETGYENGTQTITFDINSFSDIMTIADDDTDSDTSGNSYTFTYSYNFTVSSGGTGGPGGGSGSSTTYSGSQAYTIIIVDAEGNQISSENITIDSSNLTYSQTSSNGSYSLSTLGAAFTITVDGTTYTYQGAYLDNTLSTAVTSIRYGQSGGDGYGGSSSYSMQYQSSSSGDFGGGGNNWSTLSSTTIYLVYSSSGGSSSSGNQEIDPTKYNKDAYVYWDTYTETTSGSTTTYAGAGNSGSGVSSVTLAGTSVVYANSNDSSWSGGTQLSTYYPNASASDSADDYSTMEDATLIITPASGYYVTEVIIVCSDLSTVGAHTPYQCSTFTNGLAYDETFTISSTGTLTVTVNSKWFSHDSGADYYFILIKVAPIPSPLYVEYDYGDIVDLINDSSADSAFSTATGWTTTSTSKNNYGTGSVQTDDTQYEYAYEGEDDASAAAAWVHYANTITTDAKAQAAAAGYVFAGWKAEYYTSVTATTQTADTDGYQYAYNNYDYVFASNSYYGSATYDENDSVALTTNVRLIAQWIPIGITVTKEVSGLTDTDLANVSHSYTLAVQKLTGTTTDDDGNTTETWETYKTVTLSVTGDGTASDTIYPLPSGTYRVVETDGNGDLSDSSNVYYITVAASGNVTVSYGSTYTSTTVTTTGEDNTTSSTTVALLSSTLKVTNSYSATAATMNVTLKKVNESSEPLSGAVFTLLNSTTNETTTLTATGTDGTVTLSGLSVGGSYTLTEVTAPDGYNLLTSSISITVSGSKVTSATYGTDTSSSVVSVSEDGLTITVTNTAGTVLPNTGGMGTWLYTLAGLVLCGGAALVLYRRKRLS